MILEHGKKKVIVKEKHEVQPIKDIVTEVQVKRKDHTVQNGDLQNKPRKI